MLSFITIKEQQIAKLPPAGSSFFFFVCMPCARRTSYSHVTAAPLAVPTACRFLFCTMEFCARPDKFLMAFIWYYVFAPHADPWLRHMMQTRSGGIHLSPRNRHVANLRPRTRTVARARPSWNNSVDEERSRILRNLTTRGGLQQKLKAFCPGAFLVQNAKP